MSRPSQKRVLDFIRSEITGGRPFPSMARIASEFGWRDSGARDAIDRLLIAGHVIRARAADAPRYVYSLSPDRKEYCCRRSARRDESVLCPVTIRREVSQSQDKGTDGS